MRFKIDKNLFRVAAESVVPVEMEPFAVDLCAALIDAGMIEDNGDNWGSSVLYVTGPQYVTDVCAILAGFLYGDKTRSIPSDAFDAFCALIVVGDGNCPLCGGELDLLEVEGHELNDGDYYTPNSYTVENMVYRCKECGEIIKSEKEL